MEGDKYNAVFEEDLAIFTVAALFNVGFCYQRLSLEQLESTCRQRAKSVYELAFNNEALESAARLLAAPWCNNLAAVYAETYERNDLKRRLEALTTYLRVKISSCDRKSHGTRASLRENRFFARACRNSEGPEEVPRESSVLDLHCIRSCTLMDFIVNVI